MSIIEFKEGIQKLNAQLWLLMASAEHLEALARSLEPLQRAHIGAKSHETPHKYQTVIGTVLFGAPKWAPKIRLRNQVFAEDLQALAKDCESWLPGYFLVLAKSFAEGSLIDALEAKVGTDKAVEAKLDAFRKPRKKLTRKKAIESVMQAAVRGSFNDLDQIVSLHAIRTELDKLTATLDSYAKVRNQLAHRLAPRTKPSVTSKNLEAYIGSLTAVVDKIFSIL